MRGAAVLVFAALAAAGAGACDPSSPSTNAVRPTTTTTPATTHTTTAAPVPTTTAPVVVVRYRVEVRSHDPAVADFPPTVERVLTDARGWSRAAFRLERAGDAPFLVVLAEPDEAQALCRPYDVSRRYSCQNGPTVVINADRWRTATPQWTGDLATYREMLVNHEVGHLLGMHHPDPQCPGSGQPAPVMAQQSTELDGCVPNPWPLDHEIERAARHDLPLAPPFDR